jgi:cyclic pyranopterin phosphate synthase
MGAKRTPDLIPLCHPLALTSVKVLLEPEPAAADGLPAIRISATCKLAGRTGVEMEALTAAAVGALNVWDMVKGMDPGVSVTGLRLVEKTKG